ncbi:hypothetical protein BX265_5093 [Streptomyces sp. TLI_235]|jgi:hypothetical protein|nr:hypothetical protein [Streptomyces sp. TLI_235]PBC70550.1 hypothetical protein BX265_5093 [Streptomyces sp. TLI_235]
MVWALAVREGPEGRSAAEAIVEVGEDWYGELVQDALDSGFMLAAGNPPTTTGVVEVREGWFERLVLVGGRGVWEPHPPVAASPVWTSAAAEPTGVLVLVVPPGTWPPGLMGLDPLEQAEAFGRSLEAARLQGLVLHGTAAVVTHGEP